MPTETELKRLLEESSRPAEIDLARVIRISRTRRLGRQLASGGIAVCVVAGVTILGISAIPGQAPPDSVTSAEFAPAGPEAGSGLDSTAIKRAPADRLNLCAAPLAEVAPSAAGLELTAVFPSSAPVGTAPIIGTLRLTNASSERVTGVVGYAPAVTLSEGGIVLWHSNGQLEAIDRTIDLAPGESTEFEASVVPVRCEVADDTLEAFRPDLPALPAGDYELSAALDFTPDVPIEPTSGLDLVTGPLSAIALK
jgi:hypothetical protein